MTYLKPLFCALTMLMGAQSSSAQSSADLDLLSDTTWAVSTLSLDEFSGFSQTVLRAYPKARIVDDTPNTLAGWEGMARHWRAELGIYAAQDSIACLTLTPAALARIQTLVAQDPSEATLPKVIKNAWSKNLEIGPDQAARLCTGVYQLGADVVAIPAWSDWYDRLNARFSAAGLQAEHTPTPSSKTYPAGFLSAQGSACGEAFCIVRAALFSRFLPGSETSRVVIAIRALGIEE